MANLQYIGARYVPKFFLNPDDNSNDWKTGVDYEALMIVTYNNDSYTSKQLVPDSVGNPADNPDYWACTTKYTAAVMALQNSVGVLETDVDMLKKASFIVTPEMFGAVGDGVTDDFNAIQDAIDSGFPCVANGNYKTDSTIIVDDTTFILNGTINYSGTDAAIIIRNKALIDGHGEVISAGKYGIKNDKFYDLSNSVISGLTITCATASALDVVLLNAADGSNPIDYNSFNKLKLVGGTSLNPNAGAAIHIVTENDSFCNENSFVECLLNGCSFAIKIELKGTGKINRNMFVRCDTENCPATLYAESFTGKDITDNTFDFRTEEIDDQLECIQIDQYFRLNHFYGSYRASMFKVLNPTTETDVYKSKNPQFNNIYGNIRNTDGSIASNDGSFVIFADKIVFDYNYKNGVTDIIGSGDLVNDTLTFSYAGGYKSVPGKHIYEFSSSVTDVIIDLNGVSNYACNPLDLVKINNGSGSNLTVVDGANTLLAQTALAQGVHKLTYDASRNIIRVVY